MRYVTVYEAAKLLLVSDRRVRFLLKQGRIPGAQKWARDWQVPVIDGQVRVEERQGVPMRHRIARVSEQCSSVE